jgi:hypothetical protein
MDNRAEKAFEFAQETTKQLTCAFPSVRGGGAAVPRPDPRDGRRRAAGSAG